MGAITDRLRHAWNAFNEKSTEYPIYDNSVAVTYGGYKPDRTRLNFPTERSIISSILTRISIDVATNLIRHVRVDEKDRFVEEIDSGLNYCLKQEANLDQGARAFRQDIALTLLDKGVAAIVPVTTSLNPNRFGGFDIKDLRVGEIVQWWPRHVLVNLYNEKTGHREHITLDKKYVAIVENPLYSVMNEPNSTLQRLILKLNLLDSEDQRLSSGKLDLIIQVPYAIKSETRRQYAEQRRQDVEFQLRDSQYGIAYADATEKIIQLNRPVENNLLKQVEFLTSTLYSQLGLTEEILSGTADEKTMLNYMNRTIEPIMGAITEAMSRAFLTKTARAQRQTIMSFSSPFRLVPLDKFADIADKFTRNEILSSNEIRQIVGIKPSSDPKADELRNSNMPESKDSGLPKEPETAPKAVEQKKEGDSQNGS